MRKLETVQLLESSHLDRRFHLGIVLIAAATLKLYTIDFEAQTESTATLLFLIFPEAEFLGGIIW